MKIKNKDIDITKGAMKVVASAVGIATYTACLPVEYALEVVSLVRYANERVNDIYEKK